MSKLYQEAVVGVYVVRTSSLNDKNSCQLFRKASSLVLLSSSVCRHGQPKLFARDHFSLRFLFNFTSLQSFESGQRGFLFSFSGVTLNPQPFFPLFFCL